MLFPRLKFPTELEFEPVTLCNARCFTCPYTKLSQDKSYYTKMSSKNIEILLEDFGSLARERFRYQGVLLLNPFRFSDPLICKDLELIFQLSRKYKISVQIITNAVSFNEKNISLLEEYQDTLHNQIIISILGSDEDDVQEFMGISLNKTISNLENLATKKFLKINKKIAISLRQIRGSEREELNNKNLQDFFSGLGFRSKIKKNWIHNRVDGVNTPYSQQSPASNLVQSKTEFINGCKLFRNELLRRVQVMVNGDVVLCNDDADGKKKFGNVFNEGIYNIWNGKLLTEHQLVFNNTFSEKKKDLICKTCSRAVFSTQDRVNFPQMSMERIGFGNLASQLLRAGIKFI